jgi:hypothetical protein
MAVFLFLLPGHAISNGFRRIIGSFSSIEDRPFTSIAYALSLLFISLALLTGITAFAGPRLTGWMTASA